MAPMCRSHGRSPRSLPWRPFSINLGLVIIILGMFVQLSQQKDPINDFCRRFGHQTAVVDRKLYIDGGLLNWNPIAQNPANYSNSWLLYNDLDVVSSLNFPQLYANLSKNASLPDVSGGILWADNVNKRFYVYGGEYYQSPPDQFQLLSYDTIYNQWDSFGPPSNPINRVSWGAGISSSERGEGWYYGGWLSNASVPGWGAGGRIATTGLVKYNMDTKVWTNSTGPDTVPRAEGVMIFIPASDAGMLVYFGGISTPYGNDTMVGMPMTTIFIYDIAGGKWYNQTASGDVPEMRRRFCAGATWAQDQSSYNIYLYGGAGVPPNGVGFDDVYILSLPSFTWIKYYPDKPGVGSPHGSLTCNMINGGSQMVVMGGTFPLSDDCDSPDVWGMHNLDLGRQNKDNATWYGYQKNLTSYVVPVDIIQKIGGSGTGGATLLAPAAWAHRDLAIYFTRKATIAIRTASRVIPTNTPSPSPTAVPVLATGAIIGIAVGGGIFLITLLILGCVCIKRHRRRNKPQQPQPPYQSPHSSYGNPMSPHPQSRLSSPRPRYIAPVELADESYGERMHQYTGPPIEMVHDPKSAFMEGTVYVGSPNHTPSHHYSPVLSNTSSPYNIPNETAEYYNQVTNSPHSPAQPVLVQHTRRVSSPTSFHSPVRVPEYNARSPGSEVWDNMGGAAQRPGGSPRSDRRVRTPASGGSPRNRMDHAQVQQHDNGHSTHYE